ncbi:glycoside hydrolase family 55 protein [Xylariomycetidae sp. FL2044]|nr:glycoside hydrolase family 55 protein [Xylariomycetidae sp. FL2044]
MQHSSLSFVIGLFLLAVASSSSPVTDPSVEGFVSIVEEQCPLAPTDPSAYWYESIEHNGISPVIPNGTDWPVFRNVKESFGAKGDGASDDTDALQNAINAGNSYAGRNTDSLGTTGQPAVVYLPKGVYVLNAPLQFFVGMILMGDPTDPPTIKAASNFSGDYMIYAKDPSKDATTTFYVGMKNVIIDSQDYDKDTNLTLVDWSVSQACQLTNVRFNMPYDSTGHVGIDMPEGGSALIMEDLYFHGGRVGLSLNNQQYHLKSLTFDGCTTGISVQHLFMGHCQGCNFTLCGIGVDTSNPTDGVESLGTFIITDSSANNTGALVNTIKSDGAYDSIVLENVQVDSTVSSTVTADGEMVFKGSVPNNESWVWGKSYSPGGPDVMRRGVRFMTKRPEPLVDESGSYYRFPPPTYQEYGVDQFVNVKNVPGHPVAGDGQADDTASLQAIIDENAGCKVLFFPYGIYLVTDTLLFPPGSRVFGEAWSTISATGSRFINPDAPVPMVKVGNTGDVGVAQFNDMLFTVEDILPGCTLLEVNMAGEEPGDVGFWNTHFRVGGAADSQTQEKCGAAVTTDPAQCKAAFMLAHFTASSSAYVDNMWAWTADHDLDGGAGTQYISVGRGVLIESTKPSWFVGFGSEHNTLYQTNFYHAENVFMGFQQSETPYWQGNNSAQLAPSPWAPGVLPSDPDFSWCTTSSSSTSNSTSSSPPSNSTTLLKHRFTNDTATTNDYSEAECRMALYQTIAHSRALSLYAGGFWTFFNANAACATGADCQRAAVRIQNSTGLYYFGLGTNHVGEMVVVVAAQQEDGGGDDDDGGEAVALSADNEGGWDGNVAAYLGSIE